jgi:short-subunit dehydrogenase
MRFSTKPLQEQVIVITGATSGIGLATARMAARRGARLVLAARSDEGLQLAVDDVRTLGARAVPVVADVADPAAVGRISNEAVDEYGGFDTWVNNAGISIYGKLEDTPLEDMRRLFDVNFWGVVHGCRTAVARLKEGGGVIINLGSVVSDRAIPLQGIYSASKHAVKGYTDALRMELEKEGLPIAVTLIKPTSIATPYVDHARSYMAEKPTLPPPAYHPEAVARAILRCAERPVREVVVGAAGHMISTMGRLAPRITDRYMEAVLSEQEKTNQPAGFRPGSLYEPGRDGREQGSYGGRVLKSSTYTQVRLSPMRFALPAAAALAVAFFARR